MQSSAVASIYFIGYLIAIIAIVVWFWKIKKGGQKIPLKAKIFAIFIVLSGPSVIAIMLSPSPSSVSENQPSVMNTYYVKTSSANVRECPSTSCKIIDSLPQNEKLTFPGNPFDKYPDWAEVTFPNGQIGYVSKTTLSENPASERQLTPTDGSSSIGGITIGPWSNIQTIVGESYEFHFCEPPSAISGATCGALADTTTDPRGGKPPYSFAKKSGFLPPGMTLELNGTLSGSPNKTGTYNFRLCAKDLYGGEGCQNLAVVVKQEDITPISQPPIVQPPTVTEETPRSVNVTSASCEFVGFNDKLTSEKQPIFRVKVSGTVSGPVDSYLKLDFEPWGIFWSLSHGQIWKPSFCSELDSLITSSWTNSETNLERKAGDPETTSWTLTDPCWSDKTGAIEIEGVVYTDSGGMTIGATAAGTMNCSL